MPTTQAMFKNKVMAVANQTVPVGQVPASCSYATHSILLQHTNRQGTDASVQLYMTEASSGQPVDMVANVTVPKGGNLTITCELAGPGENILIASDSSEVAVRHTGVAVTVTA